MVASHFASHERASGLGRTDPMTAVNDRHDVGRRARELSTFYDASQSETREMRADDVVALTRHRFESPSLQDLDPSIAARDQSLML
jgi:hypothetical protein